MAFLIPQFYVKETFPLCIKQESAIADLGVIATTYLWRRSTILRHMIRFALQFKVSQYA